MAIKTVLKTLAPILFKIVVVVLLVIIVVSVLAGVTSLLRDTFVIGSKNKIENLPLGRYYIMEITPGEGYLLDDKIYVVQLDRDNLDIKRTVYDEVIKRKIEIFKVYASNETGFMVGEENIQFDIFDKDNNLVTSITTDSDGYASTYLVYHPLYQ